MDMQRTTPQGGDPMRMAADRLRWIDRRQTVLSQNVANADTPGYRPRDVAPFASLLTQAAPPAMAVTDARHLLPAGGTGALRARQDRRVSETTPSGNAVALDEQALKIAENETAHQLATGLHHRYVTLFRTALGRNG